MIQNMLSYHSSPNTMKNNSQDIFCHSPLLIPANLASSNNAPAKLIAAIADAIHAGRVMSAMGT